MKRVWYVFLLINRHRAFFLFAAIFLSATSVVGQASEKAQDLRAVLRLLEQRFQVSFSYADQDVVDTSVAPPADSLTLEQSLVYLKKAASLEFERLDGRFIAIRKLPVEQPLICGYLTDSATGDPVPSATVSSGTTFATSDANGYFEILPTAEALQVRHVGYHPVTVEPTSVTPGECLAVLLTASIVELDEVFVSNYLVRGISRQMNGAFEVKPKQLQVLSGMAEPDVLYTMQALPGIQSPNESVSDINIRGGTNDQSLFLWDGIKMYQSSHFYGLITAFNPYFTDKVLLTKNGTESRYGESVSGTIDIRSSDEVADQLSGGAGVNLLSADAYVTVPVSKKASVSVAGRRSIADFITTPTYHSYFERAFRNTEVVNGAADDSVFQSDEEFYFYDVSLKANYAISDKDKVSLSFLQIYNDLNYTRTAKVNGVEESKASGLTQQSLASGLFYERRWSPSVVSSVTLPVSWYQLRGVNNDVLNSQRLEQENEVLDVGLKVDSRFYLTEQWDLTAGLQFNEVGIGNLEDLSVPAFRRYIKEVNRSQVLFADANYSTPSGNTSVRGGVRANYYPTLNLFVPEPRLFAHHKLSESFSLELLAEQKNQYSTQVVDLQQDFLGVEKRRWVLANGTNVPVIRSRQVSLGFIYNPVGWLFSFEPYYKLVDGILTSSQGFRNQFQYLRSSGSYSISGADVLLKRDFDRLSSWLSYAMGVNKYDFPQLSVRLFPNNLDVFHNLTAGLSYKYSSFETSATVNWHTGRPFTSLNPITPLISGELNYELPNASRLDAYLRIDLSGRYNFDLTQSVRAQAGFAVWNLTAYDNVLSKYYSVDARGEPIENRQTGLNITPNVMFRVFY